MLFSAQCPGCRALAQLTEQQLGTTVVCPSCGMMFTTKAPVVKPSATPLPGPRPPLSSNSHPGTTPNPSGGDQGAPPAAPASADADDALPDWDDAAVSALLSGSAPAPAQPGVVHLDVGGATSVGRVRKRNEDSFLIQRLCWSNKDLHREIVLAVVADGLGGHQAGDQASGLLINMVASALAPLITGALGGQPVDPGQLQQAIDSAIKSANLAIQRRAQGDAHCRGMASTVAVVLVWDSQVVIGHVGDCRVYHFRHDGLTQVTRDQTLVARMVQTGQLTPEQAVNHPARNEVAQAVGLRTEIEPAPYHLRLGTDEWLIIACDGLHAHVDLPTLEQTLRTSIPGAAYVANNLVDMANQAGGTDNCTVVALRTY